MKTYIALLRGINVGGHKKIKMADLRESLEKIGLKKVGTYIQSGNVVFDSELGEVEEVEKMIYNKILKDFGFEVPILILTEDEIQNILEANPFVNKIEENKLYYVLLKQSPKRDLVDQFNELNFPNEDFSVTKECVYLCCKKGYGNAKLGNNLIENKLKVQATARNFKTMEKLLEMARNN